MIEHDIECFKLWLHIQRLSLRIFWIDVQLWWLRTMP